MRILLTKAAGAIPAIVFCAMAQAQPVLETGNQRMPGEWIDQDTKHKVVRIVQDSGKHASFYFHNNPFVGDEMVYYGWDRNDETQLFKIDLKTRKSTQLTDRRGRKHGEIVSKPLRSAFYQTGDSVFQVNVDTRKEKLVFVFPQDFRGDITTINSDGTKLGGAHSLDAEKEISKKYPAKSEFFTRIMEARYPRTLFTIDLRNGKLERIFRDSAWLNHVQFSPTDPKLLMFCHEGHWHKVDRIWTINTDTKDVILRHKRTMDMEIAGHEWFSPDGKTIWYDLQLPRGGTFFVSGTDVKTNAERKYEFDRNQWSVHYTSSPDQKSFAGDGGHSGSVAKAPDGKWIYLFKPDGDRFANEKLVSLKHHEYRLEPNVHFSPDGKWVIFRANFEGYEDIYAVEI